MSNASDPLAPYNDAERKMIEEEARALAASSDEAWVWDRYSSGEQQDFLCMAIASLARHRKVQPRAPKSVWEQMAEDMVLKLSSEPPYIEIRPCKEERSAYQTCYLRPKYEHNWDDAVRLVRQAFVDALGHALAAQAKELEARHAAQLVSLEKSRGRDMETFQANLTALHAAELAAAQARIGEMEAKLAAVDRYGIVFGLMRESNGKETWMFEPRSGSEFEKADAALVRELIPATAETPKWRVRIEYIEEAAGITAPTA